MRNLIIFFFIIVLLLFVRGAHAQTNILNNPFVDPNQFVPGIGCGVAQGANGSDRCCVQQTYTCDSFLNLPIIQTLLNDPGILGVVGKLPILGGLLRIMPDNCNQALDRINSFQKNVGSACLVGTPSAALNSPACTCVGADSAANTQLTVMCYRYLKTGELGNCLSCSSKGNVWTAIGCVPLNFQSFLSGYLIPTGIGLAGIVSLICIIYAAFMLQTSQGNPEKIKKAQENLTSCILGLLLIIFSVFILRLIGVDILKIPFLK